MKRIAFAALVAVLTSCGLQPLSVWRVTMDRLSVPDSCLPEGSSKPTTTTSWDKVRMDLGAWELYEGAEEKFFLTATVPEYSGWGSAGVDSVTLEGTYADGKYTFEGTVTVTSKDKAENPNYTRTDTTKYTVTLTMDGDSFTGTSTTVESSTCSGTCDPNYEKNHPTCSLTANVQGSKVEAENMHLVGMGGSGY